MKTKQEIENMKFSILAKLNELSERIVRTSDDDILLLLTDKRRQLMAQYNILLEVLK